MAVRGAFSKLEQAYVLAVMSDSVIVAGISHPTNLNVGPVDEGDPYGWDYGDRFLYYKTGDGRVRPTKYALTLEFERDMAIKEFKGAVDLSKLVRDVESRAELRAAQQRLLEAEKAVANAKRLLNREQEKALYVRGSTATAEEVVRSL